MPINSSLSSASPSIGFFLGIGSSPTIFRSDRLRDMSFDLIIKNGVVATAADLGKYDIGIKDGKIAVLSMSINPKDSPNARVIDAEGAFITVRFF